jgi:hypothetical protein
MDRLVNNYDHGEIWEEEVKNLRAWWNQAKQQPFAEPE